MKRTLPRYVRTKTAKGKVPSPAISADEQRRRAITDWWERQSILDFIRRVKNSR